MQQQVISHDPPAFPAQKRRNKACNCILQLSGGGCYDAACLQLNAVIKQLQPLTETQKLKAQPPQCLVHFCPLGQVRSVDVHAGAESLLV